MTVHEIRDIIKTLLADELGTYTLSKGGTSPAIYILATGDSIPAEWKVSGLECIIRKQPTSRNSKTTFDGVLRHKNWQLYLCQWQGSNTLDAAIAKLENRFPSLKTFVVSVSEVGEIKEQVSVRFVDQGEYTSL
jgi:hypothetical protein